MAASTPESRPGAPGIFRPWSVALLSVVLATPAFAQEVARPELTGRALLGEGPLASGTVVLHHVGRDAQGEIDSVRVDADGRFSFRLPAVPDPARSDVYFASVRYAGILYFGRPVTTAVQLDSLYEIQTYDTLMAPEGGLGLVIQARNLFLEQEDSVWRVTDLFQVRNDGDRTVVARDGGAAWSYPLPAGARNPEAAQADFADGGPEFQDGDVRVRSAIPPGERIYVVRYATDSPFLDVPMPGETEVVDVLVREPAPALDLPGLTALEPVELEPGTTYRRYHGEDLVDTSVRLIPGEEPFRPPVRVFSVVLALGLAVLGLWATGAVRRPAAPTTPGVDRQALILEIARLDEAFEQRADAGPEERGAYQARRDELMRRLRGLG